MATNSKKVRELRDRLSLTPIQRAVLVGCILGDGCLVGNAGKKSWKMNYRLQIDHSDKQRDYVFWKRNIFKEWVLSEPRYVKQHNSWCFKTMAHPEITELHELFYRNRRKIIPQDIGKLFVDPLILAVWIMDDGFRKSSKSVSICMHSFSQRDIELLRRCLKENFELITNLHWDGKGNSVYFPARVMQRVHELVGSFILPSLRYKIHVAP